MMQSSANINQAAKNRHSGERYDLLALLSWAYVSIHKRGGACQAVAKEGASHILQYPPMSSAY